MADEKNPADIEAEAKDAKKTKREQIGGRLKIIDLAKVNTIAEVKTILKEIIDFLIE